MEKITGKIGAKTDLEILEINYNAQKFKKILIMSFAFLSLFIYNFDFIFNFVLILQTFK